VTIKDCALPRGLAPRLEPLLWSWPIRARLPLSRLPRTSEHARLWVHVLTRVERRGHGFGALLDFEPHERKLGHDLEALYGDGEISGRRARLHEGLSRLHHRGRDCEVIARALAVAKQQAIQRACELADEDHHHEILDDARQRAQAVVDSIARALGSPPSMDDAGHMARTERVTGVTLPSDSGIEVTFEWILAPRTDDAGHTVRTEILSASKSGGLLSTTGIERQGILSEPTRDLLERAAGALKADIVLAERVARRRRGGRPRVGQAAWRLKAEGRLKSLGVADETVLVLLKAVGIASDR
jgi:hypothetical protein